MNRLLFVIVSFWVAYSAFADSVVVSGEGGTAKGDRVVPMQESASFPGGVSARIGFLQSNLTYPKECYDNGIEGVVSIRYTVRQDGSLDGFEVSSSSGNEQLDAEAMRVVRLFPKHTPSRLKGEPVESTLTLPVSFRLK